MSSRTLLTSIVMIVSFLTMLVKVASRASLAVTTLAAQQNRRDVRPQHPITETRSDMGAHLTVSWWSVAYLGVQTHSRSIAAI